MAEYAGLQISQNSLRAVRGESGGDGLKITDIFSSAWSDAESLAAALRECSVRFGPGTRYAVGIPQTETSIRHVSFPFSGDRAIRAALPFEMEAFLPYPAAETETTFVRISSSKEETKTLAIAARKDRLAFYRNALKEGGLTSSVLPEAVALLHLYRLVFAGGETGPVLLADAGENDMLMCFADMDGFCDLHSTSVETSEIPRFVSAVGREPSEVFVGGENAEKVGGDKYGTAASWKGRLEAVFGPDPNPVNLMTPLGLLAAAESRSQDGLFLGDSEKRAGLPAGTRFAAFCAAAFAVLALGNLAYGYIAKKSEYERIRQRTAEVFNAALPGKKAVKPAVQLKQKLEALDKKMRLAGLAGPGRVDLLWVLKRMSETLPEGLPFEVEELLYEDDAVAVSGKTDKFESVTRIKELYSIVTPFKSCEVADSKATADGKKVSFKLRMHL